VGIAAAVARIRRRFALRKRHQNKHLDFDAFPCHAGGREFESRRPRHCFCLWNPVYLSQRNERPGNPSFHSSGHLQFITSGNVEAYLGKEIYIRTRTGRACCVPNSYWWMRRI
jgi:hypothetical protein